MIRYLLLMLLILVGRFSLSANYSDITFIENKGQWDKEVLFMADLPGGKLIISHSGLEYRFIENDDKDKFSHPHSFQPRNAIGYKVLFGAEPRIVSATGVKERPEVYNYYLGRDQEKWASACRAFERVIIEDVFRDTDMIFYTADDQLKYDLVLGKQADLAAIQLIYSGNIEMFVEDGCTFIKSGSISVIENRPVAFQYNNGKRIPVDCQYVLDGNRIGFSPGKEYQKGDELIIDPELIFSTFSGSVADNFGYSSCFDEEGGFYSGGIVFGNGFSSGNGLFSGGTDAAILKYDSTGSKLEYVTYLGGSSQDSPLSMIVNHQNELVILGATGSEDYPVTDKAYDRSFNGGVSFFLFGSYPSGCDMFLSTLDPNGKLLNSTLVGGSANDGMLVVDQEFGLNYGNNLIYNYGDYNRGEVMVDENDNIIVASHTSSEDFPVANAFQGVYGGGNSDAVVFSLDPALQTLRWSTFLGGSNDDAAYSVKVNSNSQIVVGGGTESVNFPFVSKGTNDAYHGGIDGFVSVLDPATSALVQGSFLGTSDYDQVYLLDLDIQDNIYVMGQTAGSYPVSEGVYSNTNSGHFIHKLTPDLGETVFSTVFGTGEQIPALSPTAFSVLECGNILLSGWGGIVNTSNSDKPLGDTEGFPITDDAYQSTSDGSDFYLMQLGAEAEELLYATYFGANSFAHGDHVDGGTSRFDKKGVVYQSVCSCGGSDDNFPTTDGAWSETNESNNNRCNNAAFKFDVASLKAAFSTNTVAGDAEGITYGCPPFTMVFENLSLAGRRYEWDFGDGTVVQVEDEDRVTHTYQTEGEFLVMLTAYNESTCQQSDMVTKTVNMVKDEVDVIGGQTICAGESVELWASGGTEYSWRPTFGLDNENAPNPTVQPDISVVYTVTILTEHGCEEERMVNVRVNEVSEEDFDVLPIYECGGQIAFQIKNNGSFGSDSYWDFGDGSTSSEPNPRHVYSDEASYSIRLEPNNECTIDHEVSVRYEEILIPNVFTPNNDGVNDFFVIQSPFEVVLEVFDKNGTVVYESSDYQNDWSGKGLAAGVYYYQVRFDSVEEPCSGWVQLLR